MSPDKLIGEQSVPRLRLWHIKEVTLFLARSFHYLTVDIPSSEIYPFGFPK